MAKYLAPSWQMETWLHAAIVRTERKKIEQTGEAKDFVKGVGGVSRDERELMCRLLERVMQNGELSETGGGI